MAGVALSAAALSFALTLALTAGPETGMQAADAGQQACACVLAAPISSRALWDAAATQDVISELAEEQAAGQAEAERSAERARAAEVSTNLKNSAASGSGEANGSSEKSSSSGSSASKPSTSQNTRTITVDGVSMSYTESYGASSAPSSGAGVWKGSDSTTDGSFAYFIGHNPGSFAVVARAGVGSSVTVVDAGGQMRTYTVKDAFTVPRATTWSAISERVSGYGESVILQTCVVGGYKILVAD